MVDTQSPTASPARTPTSPAFVVRPLTADEWGSAKDIDGAAFGYEPDHDFLDTVALPALDIRRFTGVFDPALNGMLVGIGAIQSRSLTFPGHGPAPVAAVTWVGVRPDQQRRGVLREVMAAQLGGLHQQQAEPVAILTASEAGIYGRFGYGLASLRARLQLPAPTPLRPGTVTEPVLEIPEAEALPKMRELHRTVASTSVGFLDRPMQIWADLFSNHPFALKGRGRRRFVLHTDGYAAFQLAQSWTERGPDYTLTVVELVARTAVARASLWRHLLAYPLVRTVVAPRAWVDEPLLHLISNPRVLASDTSDNVWVRLVDLPRAIPLRTYRAASVVARVVDPFCPWNDGIWRLDLAADRGTATRTDAPPDLQLDISDLGAAFLGGTKIAALAAAGRVTGDAAAIDRLDLAMGTSLQPWTPEGF